MATIRIFLGLALRLTGVIMTLAVVLVAGLLLIPAERLGRIASDHLSAQIGREVTIGAARIALWPELGLAGEGLRVRNADWAGPEPLLQAQGVSLGLDALDALAGRITVRRATLDAPVLRLSTDATGRANWQRPGAGTATVPRGTDAPAQARALPAITLDRVRLQDGTLIVAAPDGVTRLDAVDLALRWPEPSAPLEAVLAMTRDGAPLRIEATLDAPASLAADASSGLALRLEMPGGDVTFAGQVTAGPEADGVLTLELADTAQAARALGALGLDLPKGLGRSIRGTADIALTPGPAIAINSGDFRLDGNALRLTATAELAGKPRISARIDAGALDMTAVAGRGETPGGGNAPDTAPRASGGWSQAPIDASGLGAFDGRISVSADSLAFGDFAFGPTRATVTVTDSRAVAELAQMSAYGGTITGTAVANNRNGFSARLDLALAGVELQGLLGAAMGVDRFEGPVDGRVSLLGVGGSVDALMRSLDGDGRLAAGPGRINGIDLDRAFTGSAVGGTTIFTTGTASFRVRRGVLVNDDLALDLPVLEAAGDGEIDLGRQGIDYVLSVGDPSARGGRGVVLPVRLKGPWSDVAVRIDGARAMDQNLADEREALQGRLRDRVADELGATPRDGESTEDMLRREVEDRVRDGLLDLLGR